MSTPLEQRHYDEVLHQVRQTSLHSGEMSGADRLARDDAFAENLSILARLDALRRQQTASEKSEPVPAPKLPPDAPKTRLIQIQQTQAFVKQQAQQGPPEDEVALSRFFSGQTKEKFALKLNMERLSHKVIEYDFDPLQVLGFEEEAPLPTRAPTGGTYLNSALVSNPVRTQKLSGTESAYKPLQANQVGLSFSSKAMPIDLLLQSWMNSQQSTRQAALLMQTDWVRLNPFVEQTQSLFQAGAQALSWHSHSLLKAKQDGDAAELSAYKVHLFRPKQVLQVDQELLKAHPITSRPSSAKAFERWSEPQAIRNRVHQPVTLIEEYIEEQIELISKRFRNCLQESFRLAKAFKAEGLSLQADSLLNTTLGIDQKMVIYERHQLIVTDSLVKFLATPYHLKSGRVISLGLYLAGASSMYSVQSQCLALTDYPPSLVLMHIIQQVLEQRELTEKSFGLLCLMDKLIRASGNPQDGHTELDQAPMEMQTLSAWLLNEQAKVQSQLDQTHHCLHPSIDYVEQSKNTSSATHPLFAGLDYSRMRPRELLNFLVQHTSTVPQALKKAELHFDHLHQLIKGLA